MRGVSRGVCLCVCLGTSLGLCEVHKIRWLEPALSRSAGSSPVFWAQSWMKSWSSQLCPKEVAMPPLLCTFSLNALALLMSHSTGAVGVANFYWKSPSHGDELSLIHI